MIIPAVNALFIAFILLSLIHLFILAARLYSDVPSAPWVVMWAAVMILSTSVMVQSVMMMSPAVMRRMVVRAVMMMIPELARGRYVPVMSGGLYSFLCSCCISC